MPFHLDVKFVVFRAPVLPRLRPQGQRVVFMSSGHKLPQLL